MELTFWKFHGTGNDFILLNDPEGSFLNKIKSPADFIATLCRPHTGIGADGLILLQKHKDYDFRMRYFNADGYEGSMCGNGGRCIAAFAHLLGITDREMRFLGPDGVHQASINKVYGNEYDISLSLRDTPQGRPAPQGLLFDTGSPHLVIPVQDITAINTALEGPALRNSQGPQGININFISRNETGQIAVRTWERGVEAETLSCGTGVAAAALAASELGWLEKDSTSGRFQAAMHTSGGTIRLSFDPKSSEEAVYRKIWLRASAHLVFRGTIASDEAPGGETLRLRALEIGDLDFLYNTENDPENLPSAQQLTPYSRFFLEQYILNSSGDIYQDRQLRQLIELPGGTAVGLADLFDLDIHHRRAALAIYILRPHRRKNLAFHALKKLISYANEVLGLEVLYAHIEAGNKASIALFKKLGFTESGLLRQWNIRGNSRTDQLIFQLILPPGIHTQKEIS